MKKRMTVLTAAVLLAVAVMQIPASAAKADKRANMSMTDGLTGISELREQSNQALDSDELVLFDNSVRYITADASVDEVQFMMQLCSGVRDALLNGQTRVAWRGPVFVWGRTSQLQQFPYFCPYFNGDTVTGFLSYYSDSGKYAYLTVKNTLTPEQTRQWVEKIDAAMAELIAVGASDALTVSERALATHDYMVSHYHYTTVRDSNGRIPMRDYYPSYMLLNGEGVCQCYSFLFQYALVSNGIECYTISSDTMNHAWNLLGMNGTYYHIDLTWDDPMQDKYGQVSHEYFLLSDWTIAAKKDSIGRSHNGWNAYGKTCTDSRFENRYYTKAVSPVVANDIYRYYIDQEGLKKYNRTNGEVRKLDDIGTWMVWGNSGYYYSGKYSGLFEYNGKLYYNSPTDIRTYDLQSGQIRVVSKPSTAGGYVYGTVLQNNRAYYALQTVPGVSYERKAIYSAAVVS